jgi:hypothetical protein
MSGLGGYKPFRPNQDAVRPDLETAKPVSNNGTHSIPEGAKMKTFDSQTRGSHGQHGCY